MDIDSSAIRAAIDALPGLPHDGTAPVFAEPWQAQAFAIVVSLQRQGVFSWDEWAAHLGAEIKSAVAAGDPDDGSTYYNHWLAALETLVAEKGVATRGTLSNVADAWGRAAERTPHGEPITLSPGDFDPDAHHH
jgi:nitrile hydratase accessory protein